MCKIIQDEVTFMIIIFIDIYLIYTHAWLTGLKAVLDELLEYGGQVRIPVDVAVAELLGRVEGHEADGGDAVGAAGVVEFDTWISSLWCLSDFWLW